MVDVQLLHLVVAVVITIDVLVAAVVAFVAAAAIYRAAKARHERTRLEPTARPAGRPWHLSGHRFAIHHR